MQHYKLSGDWDSMHTEGGVVVTLFFLLLWDVIFDSSIPYVFQTAYQDAPLDLLTGYSKIDICAIN